MEISDAKKYPIVDYFREAGIQGRKAGSEILYHSPAGEKTASLSVNPRKNVFFDYSTGVFGDVLDLIMFCEGCTLTEAIRITEGKNRISDFNFEKEEKKNEVFSTSPYYCVDFDKKREVIDYAKSRRIFDDFFACHHYPKWIKSKSNLYGMGFLHRDKYLRPVGVRIRSIDESSQLRWRMIGKSGFYCLETGYVKKKGLNANTVVIISESETSSNSLMEWLKMFKYDAVVVCIGGVSSVPAEIPIKYKDARRKFFVIDYDGDEEKYLGRAKRFTHLQATEIKIPTRKDCDINWLWRNKQYEHLHRINKKLGRPY